VRLLGTAFVLTAVVLAVGWTIVHPTYLTNDDVTIRLAIAGDDLPGVPPTSHLVSVHEALARTAVLAQRTWPTLPVWDLILAVTLTVGISGLCTLAWSAPLPGALLAVLATLAPLLFGLQFTVSAILCGGAGTLLLVSAMFRSTISRPAVIVGSLIMLTGCLVRPMAGTAGAIAALLGSLPIAVGHRMRVRRLIVICAVLPVVFILLDAADRALYSDEWMSHRTEHWHVARLVDWDSASDSSLKAAGWSENDWQMLRTGWGRVDAVLFGDDAIAKADGGPARAARIELRAVNPLLASLSLAVVLVLAPAFGFGTVRGVLQTLAALLIFVSFCIAVQALFKELPFRVLAPLEACFVTAALIGLSEHVRPYGWAASSAAVVVGVDLLAQQVVAATSQARADLAQGRSLEPQVAEVLRLQPSMMVLHGDAFSAELWWRPFHVPPIRFPHIRLGGDNGNPLLGRYLRETGRQQLLQSICTDPSILLIADPSPLDVATRYMFEHVQRNVTWQNVFDGSFRVWRCRDGPEHE
jgi:hypothetical protein